MSTATRSRGAPPGGAARRIETTTKNSELVRDRREQLIAAAILVFEEKGFHGTTVRDIGRASGLTQGTIYNYVRSKEDILYLVCDRIVTEYLAKIRQALAADGDLLSRVRSALAAVAKIMIDHKGGILLLYHESHNLDRVSRRSITGRVEEFISSFELLLREAAAVHAMSSRNARTLANIVTFLPTIFALRGWGFSHASSQEELVSDLVEFMARGLGLPDSPCADDAPRT